MRLVEAGGDCCACCGTHLARTGEVGLIKIISFAHYKSGMRLAGVGAAAKAQQHTGERTQASADAGTQAEGRGQRRRARGHARTLLGA